MIDREGSEISVVAQAQLLEIHRSSLYCTPVDRDPAEVVIKNAIDEIYTRRPFYGSRRIAVELGTRGLDMY